MGGREARKLVEEYGVRGFKFHHVGAVLPGGRPEAGRSPTRAIAEHKLPAIFHSGHSGIGSGTRSGGRVL